MPHALNSLAHTSDEAFIRILMAGTHFQSALTTVMSLKHYGRFMDHELDYDDQRTNLTSLIQSYLSTMADLGAETWIIHGTLMGWWWNRKASLAIMPWDSDIDVHVAEDTMHFLASYYNMTIHTVRSTYAPQGKNYMLEINPKWVDGSPNDELNQIDARWIDMLSGVFIDITAVRRKRKNPGILFCKDRHRYRVSSPKTPSGR
ncbi:MAG: hypothetical protein Q9181_000161 [Wetmoreana brouardii]